MQTTATKSMAKSESSESDVDRLTRELSAPFDPAEVRFKPAIVTGNRALALAYVDARVIQDRLDAVLGVAGWQDEYECLPDGSVVCRLHLQLGDSRVTKSDVGGQSEQPDEGDRRKAAFSDALKRAAVKFGIGRYLYRLPAQWCDYDPQKKQFLRTPALPTNTSPSRSSRSSRAAERPSTKPAQTAHRLPVDGAELQRRLNDHDARLTAKGLCAPGELLKHVVAAGTKAGFGEDLSNWSGPAIALAVEATRDFEARVNGPAKD
jgi:hypothetical protein